MNIITEDDLRTDINDYLKGWYEKSKKFQEGKGKTFQLSYVDYLNLWGKRRIRSLTQWMDDGSLFIRQRRHTVQNPNPNGYVLAPVSFAASQEVVLTAENMAISTRATALQNCKMKKGDKHREDSKARISAKTKGVKKSDTHRAKISQSMKGKNTGRMDDAGKESRSAAMKAYWAKKKAKNAGQGE